LEIKYLLLFWLSVFGGINIIIKDMEQGEKGERGFTLIEVMVATGLASMILLSMMAVLSDYSEIFQDSQARNVFVSLRRRVIQNLNRRDAWTNTFMAMRYTSPQQNTNFECLWNIYPHSPCTVYAAQPFVVYSSHTPSSPADAIHSVVLNAINPKAGFTRRGEPCTTFMKSVDDRPSRRCSIRLSVTWRLLHNGVPRQYYPTGYFPYGYYPASYWGGFTGLGQYWWFGTIGAQVEVKGTFEVNKFEFNKINVSNYDFRLIKSVP
jgi:prepilin-type N-terminal cleavage/methylation domain-containing protein